MFLRLRSACKEERIIENKKIEREKGWEKKRRREIDMCFFIFNNRVRRHLYSSVYEKEK